MGNRYKKFPIKPQLMEGATMKVIKSIKKFVADESGISAVEYALLLALIGAGIAAAAFTLGGQVTTNITDATTALQG
jgi:pilus assembly protein Flp/PilA